MWLKKGDRVKVYDDTRLWEVSGEICHAWGGCEMCDDPGCDNAGEVSYRVNLWPYGELEFADSDMKYHGLTVVKFTN